MKTTIIIIFLIVGVAIIVAFNSGTTSTTEVVVIRDITDTQITQPNSTDILPLFNLKNTQWDGAKFRYVDITNVSYSRTFETSIDAENQWMGNEFERQKKIKNFNTEVSKIFSEKATETIGLDNSVIYTPIARELNRLYKNSSDKKILLIYSNLMENTKEMSFYEKKKLDLLKTKPESVRKYFESQVPLGDLTGIKIYILFQANGIKENEQFKIVSGFYKSLLESKNAQVEIAVNVN